MIKIGKEYGVRALILGVVALILGFLGLVISASTLLIEIWNLILRWTNLPIISVMGWVISSLAILLGIIGIIIDDPKKLAIAGLICGILGLIHRFLAIYILATLSV